MLTYMGAWGTSLFSDDTALDVRERYRDLIADGASDEKALALMQKEFLLESGTGELIEPLFWLALAATQWKLGRLDSATTSKAIQIIDAGQELDRWRELGASAADLRKRAKVLDALRQQLLSPQRSKVHLRPIRRELSPYQVGDVVSYKLSTGSYVLMRVTCVSDSRVGQSAIAEFLDWMGTSIPSETELAMLRGICCMKADGKTSLRYPRILLFPHYSIDQARPKQKAPVILTVVARNLPMPKVVSERCMIPVWTQFERTVQEIWTLK